MASISELKANLEKAASELNAAVELRKKELLDELRELGRVAGAASSPRAPSQRESYPGLADKVRRALRSSAGPMTMAEIGAACGVPGNAIYRCFYALARTGSDVNGRALYRLRESA